MSYGPHSSVNQWVIRWSKLTFSEGPKYEDHTQNEKTQENQLTS